MSSQEDIVEKINYYQAKLDRYAANKNYEKLVYIINKLKKIPIRTVHLELTGIGRSVNSLRRLGGEAGDCCKSLVNAWKDMVRQEEQDNGDEAETEAEIPEEAGSSNSQNNCIEGNTEEDVNVDIDNDSHNHRSQSSSANKKKDHKKESDNNNSAKENSDDMDEIKIEKIDEEVCTSTNTPDKRSSNGNKHNSKTDKNENKRHKHSKHNHEESDNKHEKKNSRSEEKKTHHKSSRKDKTNDSHSDSRSESKKSSPEGSKSSSSSNDKHRDKKSKRRRENDVEESRSSKRSKANDNNTESEHKSQKSKHSSSDEKKTPSVKPKEPKTVYNEKIAFGIDSESGASFAEALGMCGPPSKSSKKKNMDKNSPPATVTSSSISSTMAERLERAKMEHSEEYVPAALKQPHLEPLSLSISNLLPEITPNYKPLGFSSMDSIQSNKKFSIHDDEALSRAMKNKNIRTKVYSGNKSYGKVESLFDLCVRVLQDNLDALEYTGGVPFIILKPVLARATPDQLFNLEHHNPYLIEDTDDLWKRHCEKDFRTKKREELESSREMYMRCLQEREARLNAITANIKQSQDKSLPVRTTKLAYVDSVVKPPRNVARKQAKNGISSSMERKPITPSERLQQLSKPADAVKVSAPSGSRSSERSSSSSSSAVMKPKKAPLMAKTLSLFKNRFKR